MATTLDHLAWVFCARTKFADAEPLARWALQSREKLLGPEHHTVAESLNTLASLFDCQGRPADAEPFLSAGPGDRARRPAGRNTSQRGGIWLYADNLGTVCHAQGKFDDAERSYKQALAIREKAPGEPKRNLAPTLHNLGTLYLERGRNAEAEALLRRATLAIHEEGLGAEHVEVATSLDCLLVKACKAQGKRDEARQLEARALAIWDREATATRAK